MLCHIQPMRCLGLISRSPQAEERRSRRPRQSSIKLEIVFFMRSFFNSGMIS